MDLRTCCGASRHPPFEHPEPGQHFPSVACPTLGCWHRNRVVIEGASPGVDNGRVPAKRTVGEDVRIEADIFADGHDSLAAVLLWRHESTGQWSGQRMQAGVNDRWRADFAVPE